MAKTIHHSEDNTKSFFGKEDHLEVAQARSFSDMIFELLSEQKPTPEQSKLFELILNLSIDHGPDTPSAVATIAATKEGKTISQSVAAGLEQITDRHGGAVEPCMRFLYEVKSAEGRVQSLIKEYLAQGKLISGFGHRIYTVDPRAQLILASVEKQSPSSFGELAQEIEKELKEQKGKALPLNIDGAIAVVLCTWGWEPRLANAVFIIARVPGLCGQYLNTATSS
ncbi:hypothetical protein A2631_05565 [Candidatus Daviesbacteria bacterium RIFCSPHIGHO2_01_FULL_44_29]|uniref:citrate synthase (unknown stereospecificity) n=1 Tax=Candidatus Daviesbacteria bacterium RIFCSPHIGHO2_02_FULL_43_12 TaxID=1797776 RepID=A0A1F5KIC4_9BACT|nr:MAG: hypothetical protein A2631_05565 [Candidatus Daviesbacteria bacterium RIFCSPHIGHO2_01_FULL_44_29]OGE39213.1 MAG: hypothetical protein A3E86_01310 [Candidatus Daviesbacteria bacterium RIFCSPHIGHO2_12_FULL_47_45]OGE40584.1 MAG: hypothetical protein A3D25_00500 [Candidatus Daviesbacteria bacterium RIFCSPHIGHO2_02_FULL_43_12]OGE70144.1 MAG: hypothetical protein A3B55_00270 [Candidatus Daviesbacteria bacterium RIFCSPLOWO2_01_FULL_43_15]